MEGGRRDPTSAEKRLLPGGPPPPTSAPRLGKFRVRDPSRHSSFTLSGGVQRPCRLPSAEALAPGVRAPPRSHLPQPAEAGRGFQEAGSAFCSSVARKPLLERSGQGSQGAVLMSGFRTKAFPTTRRPPLSCRISLLRAFQRGKGCKSPAPNPNPCSLQCPGLRCLSTTLGALSVELEPGQQTPPFHITFPPRGIQRRDPSPQSWGEILIHFEKSLAPRIGGQSTGLAFLLGYASLLSASRTTIRVQILQLSHPQADPALSQGSRGRREWGYFRGGTPPPAGILRAWLGATP